VLQGPPDAAELKASAAAWGLALEMPQQLQPVWAELAAVVALFGAMQTQWVLDADGQPALNYAALPVVEQRVGIAPRRRRRVFADLRVMEAEGRRWFASRGSGNLPRRRALQA
jgi:hypothetical protein